MNSAYDKELTVALHAVKLASLLTKSHLLKSLADQQRASAQHGVSASTKKDESEVTVADFAAQAVLIHTVHAAYPDDEFIAEESSEMLREDPTLCEKVYQLVQTLPTLAGSEDIDIDVPVTAEQMASTIDLGKTTGRQGQRRRWILDPIDGTRTYMRGHQYAVCLSLVVNGQQQIGVLGCPNLKIEKTNTDRIEVRETLIDHDLMGGYIFSAVKGHGAYYRRMDSSQPATPLHLQETRTSIPESNTSQVRLLFTDSGASPHTTQRIHSQVFQRFGRAHALDIWSM